MIGFLAAMAMLRPGPHYTVQVLGARDQWALVGTALNGNGLVAGEYGPENHKAGFLWSDGVVTAFCDGGNVQPASLSSDGVVVGLHGQHGFVWSRTTGMQTLQVAPGTVFTPQAVSPDGTIAGWLGGSKFALWSVSRGLSKPVDLGPEVLGGEAVGVNNVRQIAGNLIFGHTHVQAFRVDLADESHPATRFDLKPPFPLQTELDSKANGINSEGWVAGAMWNSAGTYWGAIWDPGGACIQLDKNTQATSINDLDVAVVTQADFAHNGEASAFVWDGVNGLRDLNTLVSSPGVRLKYGIAINNRGQILCRGTLNDRPQSFLLTPIDPTSWTLAARRNS